MALRLLCVASLVMLAVSGCVAGVPGSVADSSAVLRLVAETEDAPPLNDSAQNDSEDDAGSIPRPQAEPDDEAVLIADEPSGDLTDAADDSLAEAFPGEGTDADDESETYITTSAEEPASEPTAIRMVAAQPAPKISARPAPRKLAARPVVLAQASPFGDDPGQEPEVVETPRAQNQSPGGLDYDRFNRCITEVKVDIRTEGDVPESLSAPVFAAQPVIDESIPSMQPPVNLAEYTPWTICFRPLYFEDMALERYGCNVGYLQSGLSGARFFASVAALPYKMTRRPPRSCQCSNGFSRCGDCPLPGYGKRKFQWDAALVETAIVTGFVFIIP